MKRRKVIAVLNVVGFIGVVVVNALANILPINGRGTGELSDLYPNLFTPVGLTFSIWGLIYLLLLVYVVFQVKVAWRASRIEGTIIEHIGLWFFISCLLNMAWIFMWHYELILYSVIVMLALLTSLIVIYKRLDIGVYHPAKGEIYLVDMPFSIYLGWISVATIANVTALLVDLQWNGFGIDPIYWTMTVVIVAFLLAMVFIKKYGDVFYGLVILWALIGVYLNYHGNWVGVEYLVYTLLSVMGIIGLYILYKLIKRDVY